MPAETLSVNGVEYPLFIHREHRHSTRASIGRKGIHIRIPYFLSRDEAFREILRLKSWANEHIQKKPPEYRHKGWKTYKDNDLLKLGSEEYLIRIFLKETQGSTGNVQEKTFFLRLAQALPEEKRQKHISILLSRLAAAEKKSFIEEKIRRLNETHFNFSYQRVFLKYNTSNWGSCSGSGNINISTRALFATDEVIDYLCIHELAHLREKNHSAAFWALVERAMPDYKEKEKWLKENTDKCWF